MIELALLALLSRLMNWGLAPVIATRTVAADAATLHAFLSDVVNQRRLLGARWHTSGGVRPSASRRLLTVQVTLGRRTVAWVTWILTPGRGTTDVDLALQLDSRGPATRLALLLGGRRRIARRLNAALATLAMTCARAAEDVAAAPAATVGSRDAHAVT